MAAAVLAAIACIGLGNNHNPTGSFSTYSGPASTNFSGALESSFKFYEAQRSGTLPATNTISFRGNSGLTDPVVGGWYDGSTNLKVSLPIAVAISMMSWGILAGPEVRFLLLHRTTCKLVSKNVVLVLTLP
jgi:endoglucanase